MKVREAGRTYDAVIVGSPNVNPGYKLVDNPRYPQIAADYERTFRVLRSLPCDLFLGAHGSYFDMEAKYARMKTGAANVFVDPDGYRRYSADRERAFRAELATKLSPSGRMATETGRRHSSRLVTRAGNIGERSVLGCRRQRPATRSTWCQCPL
jgi:hypothetical protein